MPRRLRRSFRFCAAYSVFLASVTLLTAQSGLLHVPLSPLLAWVFVIASAALAVGFDRWLVPRCPLPRRPLFREAVDEQLHERWWRALAVLGALAYAVLWIPAYCHPDMSWDGMSYHIPTINQWALKGYIHWIEPIPEAGKDWSYMFRAVFNGYPKGVETIAFLLARLSGDKLINAPNLVFLPLAFSASTLVARELGAPRALSIAIALLFVTVPTNVGQSVSTYVDTAFSSAVMASLALGFLMLRCVLARRRPPLPLVLGASAALGLALGDKAPGTAFFGLSLVVFAATSLVVIRRRRVRAPHLKALAVSLALMSVIALSVGGIWYVRNWVFAGNPVNPIEVRIAGKVIFKGDDLSTQIGEVYQTPYHVKTWSMPGRIAYTWAQSGRLEWPIDGAKEHDEKGYMLPISEDGDPAWPRSVRGYDPRAGGLGFLWLGGCVPSLVFVGIYAARRYRRASGRERVKSARALALYVLLLIPIVVLFKMVPMPWWARYTLWLYAPGLPALAFALSVAERHRRRLVSVGVQVGFAALVAISFFEYLYSGKWSLTRDHFLGPAHTASLGDVWSGLTTTSDQGRRVQWHEAEGLARDVMSGDAITALTYVSAPNEIFVGRLSMPIGKRRLVMFDPAIGNDREAAGRFVTRYLPRYIVWDHDRYGPPKVFLETATRWEWLGTMMLFEFGDDKTSPPLLYPE